MWLQNLIRKLEVIYNSNIALLVAWKLKWNGYMHIAQLLCLISIYLLWQPNNTNVTRKPPLPATLCLPEEYVDHRVSMICAMILLCPVLRIRIRWMRIILALWIRIRKKIRIHGSGSKHNFIFQNVQNSVIFP